MMPAALTRRRVILTRTGAVNQRLALAFSKQGVSSFLWPVFSIRLPEDQTAVQEKMNRLSEFDMVLLVSPAAVAAVAHWVDRWPPNVQLATVGEGTARVVRAAWGDVPVIYPKGDAAHSGSEALMKELRRTGVPGRVLICRGQTGREWLSEELEHEGTDVEKIACYERIPLTLGTDALEKLRRAVEEEPSPVLYVTSSEAFTFIKKAVQPVPGAWKWLTAGAVVVIHPRSEEKALEAGFRMIRMSSPADANVLEAAARAAERLDSGE